MSLNSKLCNSIIYRDICQLIVERTFLTLTLLITGNGFDLSLGLKTSYHDFIKNSKFNSFWISFFRLASKYNYITDPNWTSLEDVIKQMLLFVEYICSNKVQLIFEETDSNKQNYVIKIGFIKDHDYFVDRIVNLLWAINDTPLFVNKKENGIYKSMHSNRNKKQELYNNEIYLVSSFDINNTGEMSIKCFKK